MVQKFQKFVGQFTPIKWNVSHNLVLMKTIVDYRNGMFFFAFVFFTMQRIVTNSGLPSVPKNVISSADRAALEYGEAVIKSKW